MLCIWWQELSYLYDTLDSSLLLKIKYVSNMFFVRIGNIEQSSSLFLHVDQLPNLSIKCYPFHGDLCSTSKSNSEQGRATISKTLIRSKSKVWKVCSLLKSLENQL